jgi:hypothetical protein
MLHARSTKVVVVNLLLVLGFFVSATVAYANEGLEYAKKQRGAFAIKSAMCIASNNIAYLEYRTPKMNKKQLSVDMDGASKCLVIIVNNIKEISDNLKIYYAADGQAIQKIMAWYGSENHLINSINSLSPWVRLT